jgi:periplasmic protein TonB
MDTASHWIRWLLISTAINGALIAGIRFVPITIPTIGSDHLFAIRFLPDVHAESLPRPLEEPPQVIPILEPYQQTPDNTNTPPINHREYMSNPNRRPPAVSTHYPSHRTTNEQELTNVGPFSDTQGPGVGETIGPDILRSTEGTSDVEPGSPDGIGGGGSTDTGPPGISRPPLAISGQTGLAYYPKDAEYAGITGTVVVTVAYDEAGKPLVVSIKQSAGNDLLDAEACKAAKKSIVEPALKDGMPVKGSRDIQYSFRGDRLVKGEVL